MKKTKKDLMANRVESDKFHVGIELELKAPGEESSEHDDEACEDSYRSSLVDEGARGALMNDFGLTRNEATSLEDWFNFDAWIDSRMDGWSCEDSECPYRHCGAESTREDLCNDLQRLTSNNSFKVVSDGSINTGSGEIDAEVCWNYYASKDTVKDNARILEALKAKGLTFDKSCGLHINLNNYLNVPAVSIGTDALGFLFNLVAPSRRQSSYCNKYGMSGAEKYSMLYNQGDRIEFRFFSPTLEAEKLNHYVSLANVVYRRLAGKDAKLSKKSRIYFIEKMTKVNGLTMSLALDTIYRIDSILKATDYAPSITATSEDA